MSEKKDIKQYLDNLKEIEKKIDKEKKLDKDFDRQVERITSRKITDKEYLYYYKTEKRSSFYKANHEKLKKGKSQLCLKGLIFGFGYFMFYEMYLQAAIHCMLLAISLQFNNFLILLMDIMFIVLNGCYLENKIFENKISMSRVNCLSVDSEEYFNVLEKAKKKRFSIKNYIICGLASLLYWFSMIGLIATYIF